MALCGLMSVGANAQRTMDKLDRGLIAVKTTGGVFCSWRIMGEEYYDVKYNLYRDGTKIVENLDFIAGVNQLNDRVRANIASPARY